VWLRNFSPILKRYSIGPPTQRRGSICKIFTSELMIFIMDIGMMRTIIWRNSSGPWRRICGPVNEGSGRGSSLLRERPS